MSIEAHIALAGISVHQLRGILSASEQRPPGRLGLGIERLQIEGRPPRFLVVQYKWSGTRWIRFQKISGPKPEADIKAELERAARRLGHPIIGAVELETC